MPGAGFTSQDYTYQLLNGAGFDRLKSSNFTSRRSSKNNRAFTDDEHVEKMLYSTRLQSYELNTFVQIDVVKRGPKVYIRGTNTKIRMLHEVEMHLKQACSYLMYYGNDFERFLKEALVIHSNGKLSLVDMNKIKYIAAV